MKPNTERNGWRRIARATATLVLFASFAPAVAAHAQQYKYEIRLDGGAWLPTGRIADDLKYAGTVGAAAVWNYAHEWSAVASAMWTPSEDKSPSGGMQVNVYQYDVGFEWATKTSEIARWDVKPYLGAGIGDRTYSPKRETEPDQNVVDGYLAAGFSFVSEHESWRFGIRDYVSEWKGLLRTQSSTGNDVAIFAGIGLRF